jgi:hypothetical protein
MNTVASRRTHKGASRLLVLRKCGRFYDRDSKQGDEQEPCASDVRYDVGRALCIHRHKSPQFALIMAVIISLKRRSISTRLHGVISQKKVIFIIIIFSLQNKIQVVFALFEQKKYVGKTSAQFSLSL